MLLVSALGFTGVTLGALGSHYLRSRLNADQQRAWGTAVQYHLLHTLAMFAVDLFLLANKKHAAVGTLTTAKYLWAAGVLLFSGSIYGLALGGPRLLGPVTPIGGLCMMAGWGALAFAAK